MLLKQRESMDKNNVWAHERDLKRFMENSQHIVLNFYIFSYVIWKAKS